MSDDSKLLLTPEEAESLLRPGATIHNFVQAGFVVLGCDFSREKAIEALKSALQIEIGGNGSKSMGHPIVVWDREDHHSFFEADMEKVAAFEAARAEAP